MNTDLPITLGRATLAALLFALSAVIARQDPAAETTEDDATVDMVIRSAPESGTTLHGEPVKRIFAPSIHSWHVLDAQRLILYVTRSRPYLVVLRHKARGLTTSSVIGIRRRTSSIDARFDDIIVDGFPYAIERIEKITPDMAKILRGIEIQPEEDDGEADPEASSESEGDG